MRTPHEVLASIGVPFQQADKSENLDTLHQRDQELEHLAAKDYHERLTEFLRDSTRKWVEGNSTTVIDFRPLFAVNLHHFHHQLGQVVQRVSDQNLADEELLDLRKLLEQYTNALRDFEFIHSNRWNTSFVKEIAASRIDNGPGCKMQGALISDLNLGLTGAVQRQYNDNDLLGSFDSGLLQKSATLGVSRGTHAQQKEMDKRARVARLRYPFALVGGLALIIPVLIMVANTTSAKPLVVASVSILLFAFTVAKFSNSSPENLLAATAAYAAVLVVFVSNTT